MFRYGPERAGQSPVDTGENTGEELWRRVLGGIIYSSPAIAGDGTVYIGCSDHSLYALRPNGTLRWKYQTGNDIDSSPAVGPDGTVYFGSDRLCALNPDGSWKWGFQFMYGTSSSPALAPDGTVYIGSLEGTLYALNPYGRLLGSFNASGQIASSPALDSDGNIYFGSYDGYVYSVSPEMVLRWSFRTGGNVGATPYVAPDRTVYVGSKDGCLYAINDKGEQAWKLDLGKQLFSSVARGPDGTLYIGSYDGRLCAVNPGGTLQWYYKTDGWVDSSPAVGADGTVFFGSGDGFLYALFPNGTLKWRFKAGSEIFGSPAIAANGSVVFGSWDKFVYCVGARYTRPGAPWDLHALVNGTAVELRWRPPESDGGRAVNGYRVYRGNGPDDRGAFWTVAGTATGFTDLNLTVNGTYYYRVTALNVMGESVPCGPVTATVRFPPGPPRNVRAAPGNGTVRLQWEPPAADGGAPVSAYRIYWSGGGAVDKLLAEVPSNIRKFDQPGLVNDATYLFEMTALNVIGESDASPAVSATPRRPPDGLPSPPTKVSARAWDRAVDVFWGSPDSDGGHPVTGFLVFRQLFPDEPVQIAKTGPDARSFRDRNVTNGLTYWYYLKALNEVGESGLSQGVAARPTIGLVDDRMPTVTILSPRDGETVRSRNAGARGQSSDDSGIALVELSLDGLNWQNASGTTNWTGTMALSSGKNILLARATDGWGNNATASVIFFCDPPATSKNALDYPLATAILILVVVLQAVFYMAARRRKPVS
jgi:outer membrane protein assembly factor BamB